MAYTQSKEFSGKYICYGLLVWRIVALEEQTNHEVTLDELQLIGKTLLLRISCGTLNLVVIVVQASNVCAGELCDFSSGTTNTTANVEDFVSILDTNLRGEVVFVAGNGLVEALTVCEAAEVE